MEKFLYNTSSYSRPLGEISRRKKGITMQQEIKITITQL